MSEGTRSSRWLATTPIDTHARTRLFTLPYAGGGASLYRPWAALLPHDVQLAPIQLPGREQRMTERPFTRLDVLVPAIVDDIRTHLDRPFAIFGHSMGALLAFEVTRALRRVGLPQPVRLALSGHRAPQLPDRRPPMHVLRGDAFWDELRKLDGTPEEVLQHRELMELVEPTLRADFELCETYEHRIEAPLDIPLSLFGGIDDPSVDRDELEAWREQTRGAVTLRMFPGNHHYLGSARQAIVTAIVAALR